MFCRNPSELFLVEQSRDDTIDSRAWSYSAVSTVQSSRPTRTVCSDWATGLRVSSQGQDIRLRTCYESSLAWLALRFLEGTCPPASEARRVELRTACICRG